MVNTSTYYDRSAQDLLSSYQNRFKEVREKDDAARWQKGASDLAKAINKLGMNTKAEPVRRNSGGSSTNSNNSNNKIDESIKRQTEIMAQLLNKIKSGPTAASHREDQFEVDADRRETVFVLKDILKQLKIISKEEAPGLFGNRRNGAGGLLGAIADNFGGHGRGRAGSGLGGRAFSAAEELEQDAGRFEKPGLFSRIGGGISRYGGGLLDRLGPGGTALRFGGKKLGGLAKFGAKGFGALEEMVPGLGLILGGEQEVGTLTEQSKKRGTAFFGDKSTGGLMGSRAASYGGSALNGAMAGASIGTMFGGPVGTLIGGGIGAAGGLAASVYTDFKPQIDEFTGKMVDGAKDFVKSAWSSLSSITKKGYDYIVSHIPSWGDIADGLKKAVEFLSPINLATKLMGLVKDIGSWVMSHIPTIDDIKDTIKTGMKGAWGLAKEVGGGVAHAVMHPVETAKAVGGAISSGAQAVGGAVVSGAQAVGNAVAHPISTVENIGSGIASGISSMFGSKDSTKMEKLQLRNALDSQGVTDPAMRAGIAAIVKGESGFKLQAENSYAGSSDERLRSIFKTKLGGLGDADLDKLKKDPKAFFNKVYGGKNGNKDPDDGYNFRGRGLIQLTGRANYEKYGKMIGVDLVKNPELANDPAIAAQIAVAYNKSTYKGGGFEGLKHAVNPGASAALNAPKDAAYSQYMADNEFAPLSDQDKQKFGKSAPETQMASADKNSLTGKGDQLSSANADTLMANNQFAELDGSSADSGVQMVGGTNSTTKRSPVVNNDNSAANSTASSPPPAPSTSATTKQNATNTAVASKIAAAGPISHGTDIDDIPMFIGDNGLAYVNTGMNV